MLLQSPDNGAPRFSLWRKTILFVIYLCVKFIRFAARGITFLFRKAILAILLFLVIASAVYIKFIYPSQKPASSWQSANGVKIYDERAKHQCAIEQFSQEVARGKKASYAVALTPSQEGKEFELLMGSLPEGVTATFNRDEGNAPATVALSLLAAPDAQVGSFNVVLVYYERAGLLSKLPNFCQLNLIVR